MGGTEGRKGRKGRTWMEKESVVGKEAKVEECSISECNLFRVVVATLVYFIFHYFSGF